MSDKKPLIELLTLQAEVEDAIATCCAPILAAVERIYQRYPALLTEAYPDPRYERVILHVEMPPNPLQGQYTKLMVNLSLGVTDLEAALCSSQDDLMSVVSASTLTIKG